MEPNTSAEIKTRIPVWLYPSTLEVMDRAMKIANCKSRLGFRLGVRLMVECMDDNDGNIRTGGE